MPISGPSPYLGKKIETWAFDSEYSGYTPPDSPDVAPSQYMPGPVSSLLDPSEYKAIAKRATQFGAGMKPTTSWADVVDSATRAAQRRERGTASQPAAQSGAEQPTEGQRPAEDPAAAAARAAATQKAQAARAKVQQAQRVRQAAEQQHTIIRDRLDGLQLSVQKSAERVKQIQDDLEEWRDDNPGKDPPDDMEEDLDQARSDQAEAQKQLSDAQTDAQAAAAAVQEAAAAEDTATKELQQAEQEQQTADQTAQQAQAQADQAAQAQQAEGPYGGGPANEQSNTEQGIAGGQVVPEVPSAEPGMGDQGQGQPEQNPIARAIAQVKAQGGNADNLLDAIAAEAWKKESGRAAPDWMDPNDVKAYDEYRANWKGAFRAGQDVPLAGNLRAAAGGQSAPAQQGAPAPNAAPQQAPFDPNQPVTPSNQPPVNPNLIGGPDRPPLAGPGAVSSQPGATPQPGAGTQPAGPAGSAIPAKPGQAPGAPAAGSPQLDQANQTLAAAQARDAELRKALDSANSAASSAQKKLEAAQETAKKLSDEMSSGVGSPEYRQYSLAPALNKAQGEAADAAQQLASARARAAQTQQMLAASQQSISSAQNLVKIASSSAVAGPAATTARDAADSAQAGQLLNTMLAKATPEQQQRILADIANGGPAGTEVLRKIAEQAWYKQLAAQGQQPPPGGPPKDYIESWMGMYRAGQTGAPLIAAVKAELAKRTQAAGTPATPGAAPASGPAAGVLTRPEMLRMTPQERGLYDEWVKAGGSGRWEDFQQHAVAVGAPQPGNRRVYTDPRDAGVVPPTQTSGPAGSVVAPPAGASAAPATDPRAAGYIAARRQAGDTRSDAELEAEWKVDTAPLPANNNTGPADSVLDSSQVARLPRSGQVDSESGLTLLSNRDSTAPLVVGEDGTTSPLSTPKVYPPQLPPEQRQLWDEWRAAGGSGNWEQFRQHARAVGAGEIGSPRISDPRDAGVNPAGQVRPVYPVADNPDSSSEGGPMAGPAGTFTPPRVSALDARDAGVVPPTSPLPSALAADLETTPETIDPIYRSARAAGINDDAGQANIANGIAAWARGDQEGAWAEAHVDNAAKIAWWIQEGKKGGYASPDDAPPDYVAAWKKNWLAGDESSPLQAQLNSSLQKWGLRGAGHQPGATGFDWRQVYGENGERLAPRQKTGNDCGPTAALAFGRAVGLDPDQDKIIAWARSHGYHDGNQFQGTGAMQRMLGDMGIKSEVGAIQWDRIDAELAAGRPVMLSGPSHYWLISGKDPATGAYYTGWTGKVVENGEWTKPGQFGYLGSGPNQAVYMVATDNPAGSAMVQAGVSAAPAAPAVKRPFNPAEPPVAPVTPIDFTDEPTVRAFQQDLRTMAPQIPTDVAKMSTDDFMRAWAPTLTYIQQRTGLDAGTVMGIIMAENGGGQSPLSRNGNNYFSLQYVPQDSMATGSDGRFAYYKTPQDGLARFVGMMAHPGNENYRQAWAGRSNTGAFVDGLIKGGYAPPHENNQEQWRANIMAGAQRYRALGL